MPSPSDAEILRHLVALAEQGLHPARSTLDLATEVVDRIARPTPSGPPADFVTIDWAKVPWPMMRVQVFAFRGDGTAAAFQFERPKP